MKRSNSGTSISAKDAKQARQVCNIKDLTNLPRNVSENTEAKKSKHNRRGKQLNISLSLADTGEISVEEWGNNVNNKELFSFMMSQFSAVDLQQAIMFALTDNQFFCPR